ncbi:phosphopentomutase [Selenomonas sp. oral taxon 126]|uniref:phosphopentomutase n=1 Tax=Selenomonas sp. oral taxon 126 TaxID=712528 RepID=UPI0008078E70|nr:phosphopentomutase [Selenomonas sp. oral taxon 126]ANR71714.1 phosphopentomutase [Selenomonas sp. oral taxon 126]
MAGIKRVFLIVLDSFGIGCAPDAADFGDGRCNTLASLTTSPELHAPNLTKLGLFNIDGIGCGTSADSPIGAFARLRELSRGKDTTIGHWEIAGIVSEQPMPTYPNGFPTEILEQLSAACDGKKILCNKPYSGTQVIHDYGREQEETGGLIVYTSADSVLQIAANEADVPVERLYDYCRAARKIMQGEHGVGRIIARPYVGSYPNYERTAHRHDFSLDPTGDTMMDALVRQGHEVIAVGKISDIFAGRGVTRSTGVNESNADGMEKTLRIQQEDFTGLCFVNLVDFDMTYGHRRDIAGYARATTEFDVQLGTFMEHMREDDVLMITADHGCDPDAPGTDHTREYVPLLVYGAQIRKGVNLGTYPTFAMIGATVADMFGAELTTKGESLLPRILAH